ncbi:hypothetical protein CUJ83_04795 [Methanocella sp. CWC-04]|uniref:Uncharacterized protein n=1 Tax=Methanooceanicella nereidis TaxID=2052831 RepID=A0AAP2W4I4_9EURY|nr:DUF5320 domain-containing protein [Methanocella sp. CWC-04]MCD1294315.1 hypothetical protein [Methanocella sp. CWC-04]
MPGRDGTGPMGIGPSGRRLGPCRDLPADKEKNTTPVENEGKALFGVGRGGKPRGCGMGRCGGWRRE